jgi:hypothetical protein
MPDSVGDEEPAPENVERWEQLRHELKALMDSGRHLLVSWPSPDGGYRRPPVEIRLSADAESVAGDLHERYGDFVSLRVGALPYPLLADTEPFWPRRLEGYTETDPAEFRVELDGPLTVPRGRTARHGVLLTNLGAEPVSIGTNGTLNGAVVDLAAGGECVGGYAGPQILPLVVFTAEPAATVRIPLLVGTASFTPRLGHALPAGRWHVVAPLGLRDRRLVSPPMAFTITAPSP